MNGPFGLAYGIGAGLSQVPGAIMKGREIATTQKMRDLQLQQMQQNLEDEQNARAVMAEPWKAPEDQTVTTPAQVGPMTPEYQAQASQEMTAPDNRPGVGHSTEPEPEPEVTPGATRTIKAFSTPQQQQAAMLRDKSQQMMNLGAWRSGMALQEHANQLEQQHSQLARIGLQRAIAFEQPEEAVNFIHGLGGVNIVDAQAAPGGGLTMVSKDPDGEFHRVTMTPKGYMELLSGKDPAEVWRTEVNYDMAIRRQEDRNRQFSENMDLKRQHEANMQGYQSGRLDIMRDANRIREANNKWHQTNGGVAWQMVQARKANMLAVAAKTGQYLDPDEAEARAIQQQDTSKRTGNDPQLTVARETVKGALARNPDIASDPSDPGYETWKLANDLVVSALQGSRQTPGKGNEIPKIPPGAGGKGTTTAVDKLGKPVAKDSAGKLVYLSDGKYVYADGTEYKSQKD